MDRAERRSRTELIRARRIVRYNQIDEWRRFRTDEARERWYYYWGCQSSWLHANWTAEKMRSDAKQRGARNGAMRNEYVVGYRDRDYWICGKRDRLDSADISFREALNEAGLPHLFRHWGSVSV